MKFGEITKFTKTNILRYTVGLCQFHFRNRVMYLSKMVLHKNEAELKAKCIIISKTWFDIMSDHPKVWSDMIGHDPIHKPYFAAVDSSSFL